MRVSSADPLVPGHDISTFVPGDADRTKACISSTTIPSVRALNRLLLEFS